MLEQRPRSPNFPTDVKIMEMIPRRTTFCGKFTPHLRKGVVTYCERLFQREVS